MIDYDLNYDQRETHDIWCPITKNISIISNFGEGKSRARTLRF